MRKFIRGSNRKNKVLVSDLKPGVASLWLELTNSGLKVRSYKSFVTSQKVKVGSDRSGMASHEENEGVTSYELQVRCYK